MTSFTNKVDEILGYVKTIKGFLQEKETLSVKQPQILQDNDWGSVFIAGLISYGSLFTLFMLTRTITFDVAFSTIDIVFFCVFALMLAGSISYMAYEVLHFFKYKILFKRWFRKGAQLGVGADFLKKEVLKKIGNPFSLQERVKVIQKIEKAGASTEQLKQLYVLSQDQELSYSWWESLSIVADKEIERVALSQKSETERLHFEEQERLAQDLVRNFTQEENCGLVVNVKNDEIVSDDNSEGVPTKVFRFK